MVGTIRNTGWREASAAKAVRSEAGVTSEVRSSNGDICGVTLEHGRGFLGRQFEERDGCDAAASAYKKRFVSRKCQALFG
jgi:hypothetical protein